MCLFGYPISNGRSVYHVFNMDTFSYHVFKVRRSVLDEIEDISTTRERFKPVSHLVDYIRMCLLGYPISNGRSVYQVFDKGTFSYHVLTIEYGYAVQF